MMQSVPRVAASTNVRHGSVHPVALLNQSRRSPANLRMHRAAVTAIATPTEATFAGPPGRSGSVGSTTAANNGAASHRSTTAEQPSHQRGAEHNSWGATSPSAREQVLEETADWLRGELPSMFRTGVRALRTTLLQCHCLTSAPSPTCMLTKWLSTRDSAGSQATSKVAHTSKVHLMHTKSARRRSQSSAMRLICGWRILSLPAPTARSTCHLSARCAPSLTRNFTFGTSRQARQRRLWSGKLAF